MWIHHPKGKATLAELTGKPHRCRSKNPALSRALQERYAAGLDFKRRIDREP